MNLPDVQRNIGLFVEENDLEASVQTRLLDLISETGELSKEMLKATNYGRQTFRAREEWTDELADVLFSLVCLANSTGVDLETALQGALSKYEKRLDSPIPA